MREHSVDHSGREPDEVIYTVRPGYPVSWANKIHTDDRKRVLAEQKKLFTAGRPTAK